MHLFSTFQAAKLGNPTSILKEKIEQLGGDLHLEIHNCSTLLISAVFYSWRLAFSSLHLAIENVDDVIQEGMPVHLGFGHNSLPSGDFISMDFSIFLYLICYKPNDLSRFFFRFLIEKIENG